MVNLFIDLPCGICTLRRNSSLHCISSSEWALSCLYTAGLLLEVMIYSGVSYLFWECGTWLICMCKRDLICILQTFSTWRCSRGVAQVNGTASISCIKHGHWSLTFDSSVFVAYILGSLLAESQWICPDQAGRFGPILTHILWVIHMSCWHSEDVVAQHIQERTIFSKLTYFL